MLRKPNTFIKTANCDVYRVSGTIVDPVRLPSSQPAMHNRYAVVSYDPVRHHLTPSARIPLEGKPYIVTMGHRSEWGGGFHIRSTRRFKTLGAALKFMGEWFSEQGEAAS